MATQAASPRTAQAQSKAADMEAMSEDERALLAQVLRARCGVEEEDMERAIEQVSLCLSRTRALSLRPSVYSTTHCLCASVCLCL